MPRWYLEEKGIPYEWVLLDLQGGEHRQPEFTAINPFAKVPALVDSSLVGADGRATEAVRERRDPAAPGGALRRGNFSGPPAEAAARRALTASGCCSPMPPWTRPVRAQQPGAGVPAADGGARWAAGARRLLLAGPWGDPGWTAADCAVQAYLAYLPVFFPDLDLSPYPHVQASIAATQQRPAYQMVMGSR